MGLFSHKKKGRKIRDETDALVRLNELFNNDDIASAAGLSNLTSATYFACMNIRCNALAKIPFKIFRSDADGVQRITDHDLIPLLKLRPNPYMTAHSFLWATEFQRLEYGNAFWLYTFEGGRITAIYPLMSSRVEIMIDNESLFGAPNAVYYIYNDPKRGQLFYPSDKILHFKSFPTNGIVGKPMKHYLYDVIAQEKYSQKLVSERYGKGLQDPIVVTYVGDL